MRSINVRRKTGNAAKPPTTHVKIRSPDRPNLDQLEASKEMKITALLDINREYRKPSKNRRQGRFSEDPLAALTGGQDYEHCGGDEKESGGLRLDARRGR